MDSGHARQMVSRFQLPDRFQLAVAELALKDNDLKGQPPVGTQSVA